jgi:hypothetical protein
MFKRSGTSKEKSLILQAGVKMSTQDGPFIGVLKE